MKVKELYFNVTFNNLPEKAQLNIRSIMPSKIDYTKGTIHLEGITYDIVMKLRNNILGTNLYVIKCEANKIADGYSYSPKCGHAQLLAPSLPKLRISIINYIYQECLECFLTPTS